ncbi:ABC transporter substrate-binding protein [Tranquillimonas alkanivorans]|uniref:Carbohydrate ABC transporter substrate-binding protein, CUT1 family n=1 Tax=Tranquillimonas alkanivorans TaxID=441119 RepID=A0A1I5WNH2_9RHOB|nr:extracellular solute-binding protein [Tranquillimonas alkanivorans]SFQ21230.1 carbohydrate ABC transporter substrate-binding protein, CUT1 family [Tranquillimonas alkanivorans]
MTHTDKFRMNMQSRAGAARQPVGQPAQEHPADLLQTIGFLETLRTELDAAFELNAPNPYLSMATHLIRNHLEGKTVTPSSLAGAAGVPYATAVRRMQDMTAAGLIEYRPRTKTGKSFTLHPSAPMIESWTRLCGRVRRLGEAQFAAPGSGARDYYFGGSYMAGHSIQPPQVLPEPLTLPGGLRILVHGDPTFMVMENLKRQFEQVVGCKISQRAFSIDRLREEGLKNAERRASLYDIIAIDLPWVGEFAETGALLPLDEVMDIERLDPGDFHTAGWQATHWGGRPYAVPGQTTPELFLYRRDLFAEAGLEPPTTTDAVLRAARRFHDPAAGHYGIAWNAARGTALGHTFMMTCADFGQPVFDLPRIAGGFDTSGLHRGDLRPMLDSDGALAAAEYLMALMECSPPDILSMSWYERVRPYAAGKVAMAYGYTLLVPYFESDPDSPARGRTGYLPHPAGRGGAPIAPVGGDALGIPANLPKERLADAAEALIAFTSPEAQKLYVEHGSRTWPRYSVGADPDLRRLSPLFDAVEEMSWRDELQFWPRPPVPQITRIINICGHELHDMLRGITRPRDALRAAQAKCERALKTDET